MFLLDCQLVRKILWESFLPLFMEIIFTENNIYKDHIKVFYTVCTLMIGHTRETSIHL